MAPARHHKYLHNKTYDPVLVPAGGDFEMFAVSDNVVEWKGGGATVFWTSAML